MSKTPYRVNPKINADMTERRQREIFEALDENSTRDASEANLSQVKASLS